LAGINKNIMRTRFNEGLIVLHPPIAFPGVHAYSITITCKELVITKTWWELFKV